MEVGWGEQDPKVVAHGSLLSVHIMKYLKLLFLQKRAFFQPRFVKVQGYDIDIGSALVWTLWHHHSDRASRRE